MRHRGYGYGYGVSTMHQSTDQNMYSRWTNSSNPQCIFRVPPISLNVNVIFVLLQRFDLFRPLLDSCCDIIINIEIVGHGWAGGFKVYVVVFIIRPPRVVFHVFYLMVSQENTAKLKLLCSWEGTKSNGRCSQSCRGYPNMFQNERPKGSYKIHFGLHLECVGQKGTTSEKPFPQAVCYGFQHAGTTLAVVCSKPTRIGYPCATWYQPLFPQSSFYKGRQFAAKHVCLRTKTNKNPNRAARTALQGRERCKDVATHRENPRHVLWPHTPATTLPTQNLEREIGSQHKSRSWSI